MVKRINEPVPKPRGVFLRVKCPECGNEQVAFERASVAVKCNICSAVLAEPTGGKVDWKGSIVASLE